MPFDDDQIAAKTAVTMDPTGIEEAYAKAIRAGLEAAAHRYKALIQEALTLYDNQGHSLPGDMPHGQSIDALKRSRIPLADTIEVYLPDDDLDPNVDVGTPSMIAKYLELGTHTMLPRPMWMRTLADNEDDLRDTFLEAFMERLTYEMAKVSARLAVEAIFL